MTEGAYPIRTIVDVVKLLVVLVIVLLFVWFAAPKLWASFTSNETEVEEEKVQEFFQLTAKLIERVEGVCDSGQCKIDVELVKGIPKGSVGGRIEARRGGVVFATKTFSPGFFDWVGSKFRPYSFKESIVKADEYGIVVFLKEKGQIVAWDSRLLRLFGNVLGEADVKFGLNPVDSRVVNRCFDNSYNGMDVSLPFGNPVRVVADGVIVQAKGGCKPGQRSCHNGLGNYIVMKHANGLYTHYSHLSDFASYVESGKEVRAGWNIADSGMTGRVDEPYLTLEVYTSSADANSRTNGRNPLCYFSSSVAGEFELGGDCKPVKEQCA